ncbi:uncharacterized protein LOC111004987 isoform X2 [Momordica charantia]|uniref:Uncharacterized protein LOC111004987 isoform X2 n=1 Tax=Momordica charantia TaxID=3673 RepID=A0A6J1BSP0_MOMCH|nr:uncharacterized protein LOC111004987 isoform X2 [Momordica charantia]
MVAETKPTVSKLKPGNQDGGSRLKLESSDNKRKIESSTKSSIGSKPKSASVLIKSESKITSSSSKTTSKTTTTTTTTTKVREKKVYNLAGQKYDPPEEREPLRIFYESLSKQIPTSEMAEFWMMEHGMLSPEKAKRAYEKKLRRQKEQRTGTPVKSPKLPSKPESSQKQQMSSKNGDLKAKKKITNDSSEDDDFILSPKRRKM